MARLEQIKYQPHNLQADNGAVTWAASSHRKPIDGLPQIIWNDGTPFREANAWAASRSVEVANQTVRSDMSKLLPYANFLEESGLSFYHFPKQKSEQCLIRYRGHLIDLRGKGVISPSCATTRMRSVIFFYKFLKAEGLIDPSKRYWRDRQYSFSVFDANGFERTIGVATTDLSIPNRKRHEAGLEDGLQPLSDEGVKELIRISKATQPIEFHLMVLLGISSGARIGTIVDLKVGTLRNADTDPQMPGYRLLRVGPGAVPPVATKKDVTGAIAVPEAIYQSLLTYATDTRRLQRQAKASVMNKEFLFLNQNGKPYIDSLMNVSTAIRKFTTDLRKAARAEGNTELAKFRFHMTRATFGTRLANMLMEQGFPVNAVLALVKRLMLHKHEATTLKYIRWVQNRPIKEAAANAFSLEFLGI